MRIRRSRCMNHVMIYTCVQFFVFLIFAESILCDEPPCLTGDFADIQNWLMENGSLSPLINLSGYGLDLSENPEALIEIRLLLMQYTSERYFRPFQSPFDSPETVVETDTEVPSQANKIFSEASDSIKDIGALNNIIYLSLARNDLDRIPLFYTDANGIQSSNWEKLRYLSLYGNQFSDAFTKSSSTYRSVEVTFNATGSKEINPGLYFSYSNGMSNWAKDLGSLNFRNLLELDLRNCSIQTLHNQTFIAMPKLRRLYLSGNAITTIHSSAFFGLTKLVHLDLSRNHFNFMRSGDTGFIDGITILPNTFAQLTQLKSMDFSHTKIIQTCARVFEKLSSTMERLSLCNTKFPYITYEMFHNTSMKYLDISGNVALEIVDPNVFNGANKTLEVLYANYLSIKELNPFKNLTKLKVLSLSGNDIASVVRKDFENLVNLKIIDLSWNRITTWDERVFSDLKHLELLNLFNNNLNLLSDDIMSDFSNIKYLSVGKNTFICNCMANEFINIASKNYETYGQSVENYPDWYVNDDSKNGSLEIDLDPDNDQLFIEKSENVDFHNAYMSYSNMIREINYSPRSEKINNKPFWKNPIMHEFFETYDEVDVEGKFIFQLLDNRNNSYYCMDPQTNQKYPFSDTHIQYSYCNKMQRSSFSVVIISLVVSVILIMIAGLIIWKWWSVRYFFLMLKNIAILSILGKEKHDEDSQKLFVYDVFASYCDKDRQWVIEELLPQIESHPKIAACLHERDFQVGVSILENIVSCIDRSRVLLMVISNNFLLSQWCQFEMHLAQHRLLETMREQMILVLLEDIPRRKRPNTLHYLMMTKTYIVWPKIDKDKPAFWKRLKQAIRNGKATEKVSVA